MPKKDHKKTDKAPKKHSEKAKAPKAHKVPKLSKAAKRKAAKIALAELNAKTKGDAVKAEETKTAKMIELDHRLTAVEDFLQAGGARGPAGPEGPRGLTGAPGTNFWGN